MDAVRWGVIEPDRARKPANQAAEYWMDAVQRSILYWDIMRKRGNNYLAHLWKGKPPVLTFAYQEVMDGRRLERPVNYALARILPWDRRPAEPGKRPIVIIDPRAGHGPGIGGSKRDSEVGVALKEGHPVYFVFFYPQPMPGQTIADVKNAEARFVEAVKQRHPDAPDPAVIGNCQAGWAVALLGADRPDVTGPILLNGAPLSYWAGVEGKNPMRYRGGLMGGVWLVSLLSDLGNGCFDGANLIMNMEDLNPANTYWSKQYRVFERADTEEQRYLNFERWWNGYFFMTADEIHFIVNSLFVGNELEQGTLELDQGKRINLKNIQDPVLVFASAGDNITPPQQALNWIAKVYGSVEEIQAQDQIIVYLLHQEIGHLGIFVSGKVAQKEHQQIIGNVDFLDYLPPGLYEMVIEDGEVKDGVTDYQVRFEERKIADILALDTDGFADEEAFEPVAYFSRINDALYRTYLAPWIKRMASPFTAEAMRWLHPLRFSRYGFSNLNPWLWSVQALAPIVKSHRQPVDPDNFFLQMEKTLSQAVEDGLNLYREIRDNMQELTFRALYENPWIEALVPQTEREKAKQPSSDRAEIARWRDLADEGGFAEAVIRIMVAMAGADKAIDRSEFLEAEAILRGHDEFKRISPDQVREMVRRQSRILQTAPEYAIHTLGVLLVRESERREAVAIAEKIAWADEQYVPEEQEMMRRIRAVLGV